MEDMENIKDMQNFKQKYIKYKTKYNNLKNNFNTKKSSCNSSYKSLDDLLDNHFYQNNFDTKMMFENKMVSTLKLSLEDYFNCIISNDFKIKITDTNVLIIFNEKQTIWNWEQIKKNYPSKMHIFSQFRNKLIDHLVQRIFEFFPDCLTVKGKQKHQECVSHASGSSGDQANDFSDYDLTITGCSGVSYIIQIFNSIITNVFNCTPFEAFDTNLYGYSFLIPENSKTTRNNQILWTIVENDSNYDQSQKVYRELKSINIKIHKQDIWAYHRLLSLFGDNQLILLKNEQQNQWSKIKNNNLHNLAISKKAELYLHNMRNFEILMEEHIDANIAHNNEITNNALVEKLIDTLSNMNYYGDETYFTQGAFVHVVGLMFYHHYLSPEQMSKLITHQQLIHSMIENLAYFIKSKNCIIISIKYLQRFLDAYNLLCIKTNGELKCGNWIQLNQIMTFIKANLRNASNEKILDTISKSIYVTFSVNEFIDYYKLELHNAFNNYIKNLDGVYIEPTDINDKQYYLIQMLTILTYTINNLQIHTNIVIRNQNGIFTFTI